jgi:hypothetical protein
MAIIVFSRPVPFPIAPLRLLLTAQLPLYKWTVSEEDDGGPETMGEWTDRQLICGRSADARVFCEIAARSGPAPGDMPPHGWYLDIGRPTTDDESVIHRMMLLIASTVMIPADDALCQLLPGGGWLSHNDVVRATKALIAGESFDKLAHLGQPASSFAASASAPRGDGRYAGLSQERAMALGGMDETMARILHERGMGEIAEGLGLTRPPAFADERPQANRLPTMALLASQPLSPDWSTLRDGVQAVDPQGGWTVEPGLLRGRGAVIRFGEAQGVVPAYLMAQAQARSHGLIDRDKALLGSHRVHHAITVELDTRAADYADVRQVTKIATLLIGLAAKQPGCVGLYNAGVGTAMVVEGVWQQIGVLANDEIPIALWTWAAFHSLERDAISIATGGMLPFTGYEVELWNAPGALEQVAERLNGVLRYLLINGPVIAHGDTIGKQAGDKSTRCFLGDSRADRGEQLVPAMLLELDGVASTPPARPRADPPVSTPPAARPATPPASFGRRAPGGFGRKGL